MKADTTKLVVSYLTAVGIIAGTYYALVIYPYVLDSDVKLWLTGAAGGAIAFLFGDQIANRVKAEQQSAFDKGLTATPNTVPEGSQTMTTVTAGPETTVVAGPEVPS